MSSLSRRLLWMLGWLIAAGVVVALVMKLGKSPAPIASTRPSPASQPENANSTANIATQPSPNVMRTYGQVLHADLANYPDTRPWAVAVDLNDAAHVTLHEPVYVCPRGDLWITRSDAGPLPTVLARAATENEHVVNQSVRYVLWTLNRKGEPEASAVCGDGNSFELIGASTMRAIPGHRPYHWESAMTWTDNDSTRLIVPTDTGVSVITLGKELTESYCDLLDSPAATGPATRDSTPTPRVLFDLRGFLAWIPADGDFHGPSHVARFVDGKWAILDAANWPAEIIHLVPMRDGSVLQIRRGDEPGIVRLTDVTLDTAAVDEKEVTALARQLGDDDPDKRESAFARLTTYGPGIFPILDKLQANAGPEAQARMQSLLEGRLTTQLGGMLVNENRLTLVTRLRDGGAIFLAPQGVTIPEGEQPARVVNPDYLAIRPDRPVQELPAEIVAALTGNATVTAVRDEWLVTTADLGPQRYLPPHQFVPLLRPSEREYSRLAAIDGRGRWLFRGDASAGAAAGGATLIIDPTISDPTPRLAIWMIDTGSDVGWNKADWPAITRGEGHWLITGSGWEAMKDDTDPMQTAVAAVVPTNAPTTAPTSRESLPLLLTDAAGNRYYDGQSTITIIDSHGDRRVWKLPVECSAASFDEPAWLAPDRDGHFFLFNSPGKIARLRFTPGEAQPFALETVFEKGIPLIHDIRRIWLDPAGRIAAAYQQSRLAIIFPTGQISPEIADQVLPQDVRRSEEP